MGPDLFIDDSRFTTSSDNAALSVTTGSTIYAIKTGVIFETKPNSTSTLIVYPPEAQHPQMEEALRGKLLGGQPQITTEVKFLGIQEKSGAVPSSTVRNNRTNRYSDRYHAMQKNRNAPVDTTSEKAIPR